MDINLAKLTASAFLEANRLCMNSHAEIGSTGKHMLIPAVVCAAFAAEVGMKAAIATQGRNQKGHNLCKLFQGLSTPSQARVIQLMDMNCEGFELKLQSCWESFSIWRYIYEDDKGGSVSLSFLSLFALAIEKLNVESQNAAYPVG